MKKILNQDSIQFAILVTILGTILFSFGISFILSPFDLYASGLTGYMQLIADFLEMKTGIQLNFGTLVFLINIPIIMVSYKKLSKRFALLSTISVIVATIVYSIPVSKIDGIDVLTASILGGILVGIGIGLILKVGGSGGGLDIVAQFISKYKGYSIAKILLTLNTIIVILAGILHTWDIAIYSFLRILITTIVLDQIHTSYKHISVMINIDSNQEYPKIISEGIGRGAVVISGKGAYQNSDRMLIYVVISTYELRRLKILVSELSDNAFINTQNTRIILGTFRSKTIE